MILALAVILGADFMVYRAYERYQQGGKPAEVATASTPKDQSGMVDQAKSMVGSLISPICVSSLLNLLNDGFRLCSFERHIHGVYLNR